MKTIIIAISVFMILFPGANLNAQKIETFVGTITSDEEIMTDDGKFYDFVDSPQLDDILLYKGKRVEVRGRVVNEDGKESILMFQFTPIRKRTQEN